MPQRWTDNLKCCVGHTNFRADNLPTQLRTWLHDMTRLTAHKRHRKVATLHTAKQFARSAIHTTGNIHCNDAFRSGQNRAHLRLNRTRKPRTKNCIHDQISTLDFCLGKRNHRTMPI
ncbi:hypothetical protein AA103581_2371 [Gluconobacter wancherniae NBRC 103581]|nr:hypothetical protein AA103581_2371 [Gluconobacter wancherniae NBRC 103581]